MNKKLLIVESPAKIKTISKFLGKNFNIMSTMGHIMDLPPKKLGININARIDIEYVPIINKEKIIRDIQKAAKNSSEIFLAPDPDREGEIIAWHIQNEIEKKIKDKNKIYRITFNEITKPAIIEAIKNPSKIDLKKVSAQQARRALDRLVGYEVSPILWKKISKGLSAGRVQSIALKFICDREEEISNFKSEEYWTIEGLFGKGKTTFSASLTHVNKKSTKIKNKKESEKIIDELKKENFIIDSIKDKKRIKKPLPPFMTSSLQQAAYNKLGFTVKKTMKIAQNLYEGIPLSDPNSPAALITYMRTDSLRISDTALKEARDYIKKEFGNKYLPSNINKYSKTKTKIQDAHEAIRPVNSNLTPEQVAPYLEPNAAKLYELIWKRFISCQMKPAEYAQRQVIIKGGKYTFKATGSTLIFDGFLKLYNDESEEEQKEKKVKIPKNLIQNDTIDLKKVIPKQHFTQPPPRYTEASLVKALEKEGIGRPSTYATILSTIQARDYTKLDDKKKFTPTELGKAVTKMLTANLPKIINTKFTAQMEENLDKIAKGELKRDKLLKEFYKEFKKDIEKFKGKNYKNQGTTTEIQCPECKKTNLVIRFGKTGQFLGCANYPNCAYTSNFEKTSEGKIKLTSQKTTKTLKEKCPECKKALREIHGKFGPFIACSGFPECRYIKKEKASFKCPKCKGSIYKGQWKGGVFWGCENYPKCRFAIFGDIEEEECPKCKNSFLIKRSKPPLKKILYCYNKECNFKKTI